ncbi:IS66 family transposase [Pseudorhodoplanes sp.]|uniref:IS66 family transposase n=1 Tax=Pseudorhodoplanes sp. TaxID=1934341 RepID=UPI003D0DEC2D
MDIDLAALPDDVKMLHRLVRSLAAERTAALVAAQAEIERLRLIVQKLQRSQFGRRSERLDDDQLQFGFEDLEADLATVETRLRPSREKSSPSASRNDQLRFPAALEREDRRINVEHDACPCCGGALHMIGETVTEMLDHVPARLRVIRIRRPRYGCRACGTIHQASAPERPIAKGLATPALLAHVLVSKYCDHLPLYRQSQIFARHGVELNRSTLANWVGGAVWWLEPLHARLAEHVFASQVLFADDTPIPVLDPGRGRTKTGRLWVYARDDRPWCGTDPPAVVYLYSPDRRAERPAAHLQRFTGTVHVDGYPGFDRLPAAGHIQLAACWAHARRKFYEVHQATGSPVAADALKRIGELYAIEASIRGQTAEARRSVRQSRALPLIAAMRDWLEVELNRLPPRGGVADAIRYALTRWTALCRFLDDGRIELDNNTVERAIRPITLGRKNHLFAGSDGGAQRWAIVASLLATAKLNDVEPFAYLRGVLECLSDGYPMRHLDDLLPWNWTPLKAAA